ncbi:hypothetical protein [Dyadobacter sp. CY312]|uniref:hypothetical protein n=1 Tax=Dyadobacter sp. CY312 TaxID=2907303 RepID=UPI001F38348D|nr:hypothetical protein [Dyadobacter sp. CY312]MCE7044442.1 hypothetical protein [Dyadobacter sp. CY312]
MKNFQELTNSDKAKLLHRLFPQHIEDLINFIEGMCHTVQEEQESGRRSWDNGFVTFDSWLYLAADVQKQIEKNRHKIISQHGCFASFLFSGYTALFSIHCVVTYTAVRRHPDSKFTNAVDLFFNP